MLYNIHYIVCDKGDICNLIFICLCAVEVWLKLTVDMRNDLEL